MKSYDVVIVGGGPGGLSAALLLGRGRATALLVDGGPRRNARAHEVHTFLTRDGTPPTEFRAIARQQLAPYPSIEVRDALATGVTLLDTPDDTGCRFTVAIGDDTVRARRILLAVGMRDVLPDLPGLAELWGASVFQCPYCHGWELRDRPWGVLVDSEAMAAFAAFVTNWASHVIAFTNGAPVPDDALRVMQQSHVTLERAPILKLVGATMLEGVALASGRTVPCAALVMRPPQEQVELVRVLGLALDELGFARVDPKTKESSIPGIHVIGDATTMQQTAITAAAEGVTVGAILNHAIVLERIARRPHADV